jgi:signal transduction histidine kinase
MRWPLRNQIMLPLLVVAVLSIASVGGVHTWLAARHTRQRIEDQVRGVVSVLTSSRFPLTDSVLRQMKSLSGAEFVLTDAAGHALATSLPQPPPELSSGAAVTAPDQIALEQKTSITGRDYFHTAVRIAEQQPAAGERVLHILFPQDEYRASLRGAVIPPIVVGLVSLVAAAAVAHVVAGRIGRGTARLGDELTRIAGGDFAALELPAKDDEIRDLAMAINGAAERLAAYEQQVRSTEQARTVALLGAGLAHQLRNAATGCLMAIDLHSEACDQSDESLAVAKRQLRLMEGQLQRFLRTGKGPAALRKEDVELGRLVDELLPLVRPAARHAGVEIEWTRPEEDLVATADPEALGQVVLNLVTNAIEAVATVPTQSVGTSRKGGGEDGAAQRRVVLALGRGEDSSARLTISDTGPGPAGSVADSLFEPFVSNKPEGIGLGLATARQVVDEHGGTIQWSRSGAMTQFCIVLPTACAGARSAGT